MAVSKVETQVGFIADKLATVLRSHVHAAVYPYGPQVQIEIYSDGMEKPMEFGQRAVRVVADSGTEFIKHVLRQLPDDMLLPYVDRDNPFKW